jgi:hypothetical protein
MYPVIDLAFGGLLAVADLGLLNPRVPWTYTSQIALAYLLVENGHIKAHLRPR